VYDAGLRTGGRCWSLRGFFPQQVGERGGEFIDTTHTTMLGYAKRFNLALEDVSKKAGDTTYFFDGQLVPEKVVVDEFREFVAVMGTDLRRLSSEVTGVVADGR
jgi:monoamine oxidase